MVSSKSYSNFEFFRDKPHLPIQVLASVVTGARHINHITRHYGREVNELPASAKSLTFASGTVVSYQKKYNNSQQKVEGETVDKLTLSQRTEF